MPPFEIGGVSVPRGSRRQVDIPIARLPTGASQSLPVVIVNGSTSGPRVWINAAIHGDELNGVEIIRQVLGQLNASTVHGTVIAVPVVNVFGFVTQSRYLPDRRDLNRSFPGSPRGSLAAQIAHLFMEEIVIRSTHGIDLHTGSLHRTNFAHIRANLDDPETLACAKAFGTQVIVHAATRDGSLRLAAAKLGIPCLVYEAGEANRINREPVRRGVDGVLRLLTHLKVLNGHPVRPAEPPIVVRKSQWIRARRSGLLRLLVGLGNSVERNQVIGYVSDAYGTESASIRAPDAGLMLGLNRNPLVHRGDPVAHLAHVSPDTGTDSPT